MVRNSDSHHCHVPGRHGWATHGSNPPTCAPHSGRVTGAGAPRGKRKPRTTTFDSAFGTGDLLKWGTRRGSVSREERAHVRGAMIATLAAVDDEVSDMSENEALRSLAYALQAVRSTAWERFSRRATPTAHLEKLDDVADLLLDDWGRPRRRRR